MGLLNMIRRIGIVAIVVMVLIGLILYSQFRPTSNRVSGFIEADEIRIGSRLGGRVRAVHVDEGQRVRQGETLVELEPYDLLQREQEAAKSLAAIEAEHRRITAGLRPEEIAQAKSRYDQFKARYDLLVAGPREQEIEAAKGRLQLAESEQILAQQNYDRGKQLVSKDAISQAEFDATLENLDAARATLVVREEELDLLQAGTREEEKREAKARVDEAEQAWNLAKNGYRIEDIEKAKAARDAAQAALDVIREQKKELVVTCPIDGVIEALDLQKGDLVPAGAPVLSVMDDSHLWVRAYVPQNRVGLQVGQQLSVMVDSFPTEIFRGEITFISRQAEFTPSNAQTPEERSKQVFRIKVTLKDVSTKLRPGMTADVLLGTASGSP
jgi:multidrug resistance efflux pump